jgi:hypothetical protein
VAAAGVAAVAAARQSNSKLPEINNKLIRFVVLGALHWPGARCELDNLITSHLSSDWIRDITADRKRKDYYDSLEQMD